MSDDNVVEHPQYDRCLVCGGTVGRRRAFYPNTGWGEWRHIYPYERADFQHQAEPGG